MRRPRLLDLFCKAGGCSVGYSRAGFDVIGVDIEPQPRYPFPFWQGDALEILENVKRGDFDAIHASPPCQRFSMGTRNIGTAMNFPDVLTPTREALSTLGIPWVIENVPGAPMRRDMVLCGCMFGLPIRRSRWFEFNVPQFELLPSHKHDEIPIGVYGNGTPSWHRKKLGVKGVSVAEWRDAMGIDWMLRRELTQAIPPAYTELIGRQLLRAIGR